MWVLFFESCGGMVFIFLELKVKFQEMNRFDWSEEEKSLAKCLTALLSDTLQEGPVLFMTSFDNADMLLKYVLVIAFAWAEQLNKCL